ncbi:PREDICTED: cGMP-dependent 3',5'-cyclic phosphodiesterase-like [Priapulus caudatus]|uniref:Phosphodiesterase n=1 Tax=Priapulus caudatus TaxID=37621 RepID=A0ABM1EHN0_PRICU|nr:PREDICTED: cGMP-dependent 3',5'-cyclic phosphodiesterase-like [Priapulus caudatus]
MAGVEDQDHAAAILALCAELYDQDARKLQLKLVGYLQRHTSAQCGFLMLVAEDSNQLFCQVVGDKVLDHELRYPSHCNSFSIALHEKRPVTLQDLTTESRLEIVNMLGCDVQSMLCVPVIEPVEGRVVALACVVNKKGSNNFSTDDIKVIQTCFKYTAPVLTSTLAFQKERMLKNQTQTLLHVAKNLFTHLEDVTLLLKEIMQEARHLTQAERCSLFLLDKEQNELVAKVFDGDVAQDQTKLDEGERAEVRLPADQGIAGHVATSGELLNIRDAYSHPLFYSGVDEATGFRTRNILCIPIRDDKGVIGIAELCNKLNGAYFTKFDEEIATAFSVYCGLSIVHVTEKEYSTLSACDIPPRDRWGASFTRFPFLPRCMTRDETLMCMFDDVEDMGFLHALRIERNTLARFIIMVKKGYRDVPYHNWYHAFAVTHFCYLLYKNLPLNDYLTEMEIFALFVACMCHDLDHRGTNNSFQVQSQSILAALYSSEGSVMEQHHFAQAMCIINMQGSNIFGNLSSKEYQQVLDLMRDIILATDVSHHLLIMPELETMADEGYRGSSDKHHNLLVCLLMTACDLSDQTKSWTSTKKIAEQIYHEFFSQGDLEKAMGNKPVDMMDREKAFIPELQINFLEHIALPCYR